MTGSYPDRRPAIRTSSSPATGFSGSEFTGVNFSPDRYMLFANIQDEGYVVAITGPFAQLLRS
jgi:uncharacterized protein